MTLLNIDGLIVCAQVMLWFNLCGCDLQSQVAQRSLLNKTGYPVASGCVRQLIYTGIMLGPQSNGINMLGPHSNGKIMLGPHSNGKIMLGPLLV